jgi:hypothetical protein
MTVWIWRFASEQPVMAKDWILGLFTVIGTILAWREIRGDLRLSCRSADARESQTPGGDAAVNRNRFPQVQPRPWALMPVLLFAMLLPICFLILDVAKQGDGPRPSDWIAFMIGEFVAVMAVGAGWFVAKRLLSRDDPPEKK